MSMSLIFLIIIWQHLGRFYIIQPGSSFITCLIPSTVYMPAPDDSLETAPLFLLMSSEGAAARAPLLLRSEWSIQAAAGGVSLQPFSGPAKVSLLLSPSSVENAALKAIYRRREI